MTRPFMSTHAVVRWMERIRLVDFCMFPDGTSETVLCQHGLAVLGMTIDEARDEICPPRLWPLIRGNGSVRAGDRTLLVVGGKILTCLIPHPPRRPQLPREAWAYIDAPTDYGALAA